MKKKMYICIRYEIKRCKMEQQDDIRWIQKYSNYRKACNT